MSGSQRLGFAIPSNTILKEVNSLAVTGNFTAHSYLGVTGQDMTFELAQSLGVSVTYGWHIAAVVLDGPASSAGLQIGDIITFTNGTCTIKRR